MTLSSVVVWDGPPRSPPRSWSGRGRRRRSTDPGSRRSASATTSRPPPLSGAPIASLIVSSESLGIPGDDVDLVNDLGIESKRLFELRVVLRPATKHKFRFHYLPITYDAESIVQREFVFNGQRYRVGVPVQHDRRVRRPTASATSTISCTARKGMSASCST